MLLWRWQDHRAFHSINLWTLESTNDQKQDLSAGGFMSESNRLFSSSWTCKTRGMQFFQLLTHVRTESGSPFFLSLPPKWDRFSLALTFHRLRQTSLRPLVFSSSHRYLIRPSCRGGFSSDLGSGLSELQTVRRQRCRTGQALGPMEQTSAADQWPSSSPSSHRRSATPVRPALASASSTAPRLTGSRSTGFRPWKLCSM